MLGQDWPAFWKKKLMMGYDPLMPAAVLITHRNGFRTEECTSNNFSRDRNLRRVVVDFGNSKSEWHGYKTVGDLWQSYYATPSSFRIVPPCGRRHGGGLQGIFV